MANDKSEIDAVTAGTIKFWENVFAAREWGRYPDTNLVRFIARRFRDPQAAKDAHVLEVGCGPGTNLWFLARDGFRVSAIDGSSTAITKAKQRIADEAGPKAAEAADLRVGNFAQLPWPNDTFDVVFDIEALSANRQSVIDQTIAEVKRVLKPGGAFFSMSFGTETTGISTGEKVDENTTSNPAEGPLHGTGLIHAFSEAGLQNSYGVIGPVTLDYLRRSVGGIGNDIFEWIIAAEKK